MPCHNSEDDIKYIKSMPILYLKIQDYGNMWKDVLVDDLEYELSSLFHTESTRDSIPAPEYVREQVTDGGNLLVISDGFKRW